VQERYRVSIAPSDPGEEARNLPAPYDIVDFDELFAAAIDAYLNGVRAIVNNSGDIACQ
jgi:hypothetical protein